MPKALFLIPEPHEQNLPPLQDTVDTEGNPVRGLCYLLDGVLTGGWWIAPETEAPTSNTVATVIDSSEEVLNDMAANPLYLFLEDIIDGEEA